MATKDSEYGELRTLSDAIIRINKKADRDITTCALLFDNEKEELFFSSLQTTEERRKHLQAKYSHIPIIDYLLRNHLIR